MPNDRIDIRDFAPAGTPLDGSVDWAPSLQAAIDYITGSSLIDPGHRGNTVGTLHLPPGKYRIDRPLQIVKRDPVTGAYDFVSIQIVGEAPGFPGRSADEVSFHGTCIYTRFTEPDLPALVIEGARAVRLKNLMIYGQNDWVSRLPPDIKNSELLRKLYDDTTFLVPGARDNRYSPHAGICVDPYDNPGKVPGWNPADRYAKLDRFYTFPAAYPKSGGAASSDLVIDDCVIQGFVVGVALSMSPSLQNAENITLSSTTITSTKTCLAVGQSQSRNVVLTSMVLSGAKFGINAVDYGRGNGACPAIFGANVDLLKYVFNVSSVGASPSINGVYGEFVLSLGQFFGGATADGYTLNSCSLSFPDTPEDHLAVNAHLLNSANLICNGCTFTASLEEPPHGDPLRIHNAGQLTFNNCTFGGRTKDRAPLLWITGSRERVQFHNCIMEDYQTPRPPGGFSAKTALSSVLAVDDLSNYFGAQVVPGTLFYPATNGPAALRWVDGRYPILDLGVSAVVVDGATKTGSFDVLNARAAGILRGDLISTDTNVPLPIWTTPGGDTVAPLLIGKVESTAPSAGDPVNRTTVKVRLVPEALESVTTPFHLLLGYLPRVHPPTVGTLTDGSADITGVSSLDPVLYGIHPEYPQPWDVNQRVSGDFIPEGSYIKSITLTAGARTITLNRPIQLFPAGSSITVRLYDADIHELPRIQHLLDAVRSPSDRSEVAETRFDEGISLPAARLGVPGQKLRIHAMVNVVGLDKTAMIAPRLVLRVRLGGSGGLLLGSTPAAGVVVAVGDQGIFDLNVDIRSPTLLTCHGASALGPLQAAALVATGTRGPASYDATKALDVVVTAQWIAKGSTGSNIARLEAFSVEQVG
jgi:hypothetical protein